LQSSFQNVELRLGAVAHDSLVVCPNFVSVGRFVEILLNPMRVDAAHGMRGSVVVARYGSPFPPSLVTTLYRDEPLAAAFHMPFCSRVLAVEWKVNSWNVRGTPFTAVAASANLPRFSNARALPICVPNNTRLLVSASCEAESKLATARLYRSAAE